jgi:hypothetical protein
MMDAWSGNFMVDSDDGYHLADWLKRNEDWFESEMEKVDEVMDEQSIPID